MYYGVKILNKDHSKMIQEFLISKGIFWRSGDSEYIDYDDATYIFVLNSRMGKAYRREGDTIKLHNSEVLSTDSFIEKFSKKEISVELTDDYTAYLKDGFVKVGCQEIPFEKVEELYNAIYKD